MNEPAPDSPAVKANRRLPRVRRVLAVGSLVFGLSALTLILLPAFFNSLLGLQTSSAGLGVLTLAIPTHLNWFTIAYSAVGFGFSLAYL